MNSNPLKRKSRSGIEYNHSYIKRLRKRLFLKNPYCPVCGVLMVLSESIPRDVKGQLLYHPDNLCTIDHTYSNYNPERTEENKHLCTIMCHKCNNEKERKESAHIPIDELRRRSGRGLDKIKTSQNEILV